MKRFYSHVSVGRDQDGHTVLLDGRPVRTPGKNRLCVQSLGLAEALADEWRAQGETIEPATLALGRLVNTAIDLTAAKLPETRDEILKFAETDLLCYRATGPAELIRRQTLTWQPVLDWAAARYNAHFFITDGILPVDQPTETLRRLAREIEGLPPLSLTGLHLTTALTGSLLLGLAVWEQRLTADAAWQAAWLDELYQAEIWGDDAEASERRAATLTDLRTATTLLGFCRGD